MKNKRFIVIAFLIFLALSLHACNTYEAIDNPAVQDITTTTQITTTEPITTTEVLTTTTETQQTTRATTAPSWEIFPANFTRYSVLKRDAEMFLRNNQVFLEELATQLMPLHARGVRSIRIENETFDLRGEGSYVRLSESLISPQLRQMLVLLFNAIDPDTSPSISVSEMKLSLRLHTVSPRISRFVPPAIRGITTDIIFDPNRPQNDLAHLHGNWFWFTWVHA